MKASMHQRLFVPLWQWFNITLELVKPAPVPIKIRIEDRRIDEVARYPGQASRRITARDS